MPRNNLDHKRTNNSSKMLLEICKESSLRIINGRTTGDLYGKHTCITYNGYSVVDYTIVSQEWLKCISIFQVDKFTALSNHCPIVCSLCAHCNYYMPGKPDGLNIMLSKQKGICNFRLRPSVEENLQTCAR